MKQCTFCNTKEFIELGCSDPIHFQLNFNCQNPNHLTNIKRCKKRNQYMIEYKNED